MKERIALLEAIKKHIRDIDAKRGFGTARGYEHALNTFAEGCTKTYLDELTREDVRDFITRLRLVVTTNSQQIIIGGFDGLPASKIQYRSGALEGMTRSPPQALERRSAECSKEARTRKSYTSERPR